jgi:hypothetical protein
VRAGRDGMVAPGDVVEVWGDTSHGPTERSPSGRSE